MNKKVKSSKNGCIISSVAVLISVASMLVSDFKAYTITIFCASLTIFCANLAEYQKYKKKGGGNKS